MFWYPVHRQRFPPTISRPRSSSGSGLSRSPAVMVVRKPGVQNPHCRPWQSGTPAAPATGRRRRLGQPLDGGDLRAVGADREQQAGPDRRAVQQDGAGAAHAVLAADVGAGQLQVVAEEVGQQPARRHLDRVRAAPLTVSRTSCSSSRSVTGRRRRPSSPGSLPGAGRLPGPRRGPPAGPLGQHPGQVPPVPGGGVDVGLRVICWRGQVRSGREATSAGCPAAASVRSSTTGTAPTDRYAARAWPIRPSASSGP